MMNPYNQQLYFYQNVQDQQQLNLNKLNFVVREFPLKDFIFVFLFNYFFTFEINIYIHYDKQLIFEIQHHKHRIHQEMMVLQDNSSII